MDCNDQHIYQKIKMDKNGYNINNFIIQGPAEDF